jgi:predicted enzyme involved in methoxymalonyl-ACP biosynthesis
MDGGDGMSVLWCEKQTEDTLQLLKSRNFLLSFENKQLRDRVSSLERYVKELEMRLDKRYDQDTR